VFPVMKQLLWDHTQMTEVRSLAAGFSEHELVLQGYSAYALTAMHGICFL